jgi:hypothetical protein
MRATANWRLRRVDPRHPLFVATFKRDSNATLKMSQNCPQAAAPHDVRRNKKAASYWHAAT